VQSGDQIAGVSHRAGVVKLDGKDLHSQVSQADQRGAAGVQRLRDDHRRDRRDGGEQLLAPTAGERE
jgi:hypothetical protein